MKFFRIFLISSIFLFDNSYTINDIVIREKYANWKRKILRTSPGSQNSTIFLPSNTSEGFLNFKKSLMDISKQNIKFLTGRSQFQMKLNIQASSSDAAKNIRNGFNPPKTSENPSLSTSDSFDYQDITYLPPSLDYRDFGLVTEVRDQGYTCGSCYAFSANCALEGQVAKYYGKLTALSEQNIVDCSTSYGNKGCDYGYMEAAFKYAKFNPGLANGTTYPYYGIDNQCQYTPQMLSAEISAYTFVPKDENILKQALVDVGPLSIAIKADLNSIYYYTGGIYDDDNCRGTVNHAVCLVGYGTDNTTTPPTDYWIIKNSWSNDWGENGFMKMKMGTNLCGITNYVIYPNI
ncbi:hypothetical protein PVAND_016531 [Polypedilum vanderplanki]|uniref:Peptidase C1A papain C-terminal domain-containing protein n=1 Tax=Polypedilum vanderplanki TaxID=319348 RepID=A0A9J6BGG1_POLVA|nr:hypothetical protein PVAND_016531 [Polypedilum vanderplanki]